MFSDKRESRRQFADWRFRPIRRIWAIFRRLLLLGLRLWGLAFCTGGTPCGPAVDQDGFVAGILQEFFEGGIRGFDGVDVGN